MTAATGQRQGIPVAVFVCIVLVSYNPWFAGIMPVDRIRSKTQDYQNGILET